MRNILISLLLIFGCSQLSIAQDKKDSKDVASVDSPVVAQIKTDTIYQGPAWVLEKQENGKNWQSVSYVPVMDKESTEAKMQKMLDRLQCISDAWSKEKGELKYRFQFRNVKVTVWAEATTGQFYRFIEFQDLKTEIFNPKPIK